MQDHAKTRASCRRGGHFGLGLDWAGQPWCKPGAPLVGATKLDAAGGGRWTFTASGSTTNVAARIAALAKGGEIMIGPETAERVKANYVLEDAGEHRLKNVSEPVRVFRLVLPGMYTKVVA